MTHTESLALPIFVGLSLAIFAVHPSIASALVVVACCALFGLMVFTKARASAQFEELESQIKDIKSKVDSLTLRGIGR